MHKLVNTCSYALVYVSDPPLFNCSAVSQTALNTDWISSIALLEKKAVLVLCIPLQKK